MLSEKYHICIEVLEGIIILLLCIFLVKSCTKEPEYVDIHTIDTTYIKSVDTIFVPFERISYVDSVIVDTLYLNAVEDTILLRTQKTYEDSVSTIWISGIYPEIDSIRHYIPRDTIIVSEYIEHTKKERRKNWNIGIQAGIGCQYGLLNKDFDVGPYLGVGISYGFDF